MWRDRFEAWAFSSATGKDGGGWGGNRRCNGRLYHPGVEKEDRRDEGSFVGS